MAIAADNLLYVVGDSISAGSYCVTPWSQRLLYKLGTRWALATDTYPGVGANTIASNISGFTGASILGSTGAAFTGRKVMIIEAGTNDVSGASTAAQIFAFYSPRLDDACTANWDMVICQRNSPRGNDGSYSAGREQKLADLWTLIQAYTKPGGSTSTYVAWDSHTVLSNGLTGTNQPCLKSSPNFTLSALDGTDDKLHPNDTAAEARAEALAALIQPRNGRHGPRMKLGYRVGI